MTKQGIYLSLAAAVVAVIAGCGSSNSSSSSGSSSFAANADAACKADSERSTAAARNFNGTAQAAAQLMSSYASSQDTLIAKLKKLTPPSNAKSAYNAIIADEVSIRSDIQKARGAAQSNDIKTFTAAQHHASIVGQDIRSKAAAAGLTLCAGKLPDADVAAIKKLAVAGAVHPTPSLCTTSVTQRFLTTAFHGSVATCKKQIVMNVAKSATVEKVYGIDPAATAVIRQVGATPARLQLSLLKENGTWKVDEASPAP